MGVCAQEPIIRITFIFIYTSCIVSKVYIRWWAGATKWKRLQILNGKAGKRSPFYYIESMPLIHIWPSTVCVIVFADHRRCPFSFCAAINWNERCMRIVSVWLHITNFVFIPYIRRTIELPTTITASILPKAISNRIHMIDEMERGTSKAVWGVIKDPPEIIYHGKNSYRVVFGWMWLLLRQHHRIASHTFSFLLWP